MHGVHVPLVTPFTANGALDTASLERLAHMSDAAHAWLRPPTGASVRTAMDALTGLTP
jgi:hypothetical protein